MIDLKNRSRETKTYQFPRDVSAGPVRPKVMKVHRGKLNPKTGERSVREEQITVGGVLTLLPKSEVKGLPDVLAEHPGIQRDIKARHLSVKQHKNPTRKASAAPVESKTPAASAPKPKLGKTKTFASKE